jgi:ATP phosphoribosyltransferase regulatory subunit
MTDDPPNPALLPAGLVDLLPPEAEREAALVEAMMEAFAGHGYERVKPPLLEFEDTLLIGAGASVAQQTFRVMDPVSQRMMGLRADITPQVARIAASRLRGAPRPLRLGYGGEVLRVKGSQLSPERQVGQVGVELVGADSEAADAEVVLLAAEGLAAVGVDHLSIDLTLPPLVGAIAAGLGLDDGTAKVLRQVLDRKDAADLGPVAGNNAALFESLLRAAGPAEQAVERLLELGLPGTVRKAVDQLAALVALIRAARPQFTLTIDPVEHRGFEYHTGVSFTVFARDVRGELGRGGRYVAQQPGGSREPSTGFTLYMEAVLRALPVPEAGRRIYVPSGIDAQVSRSLRAAGWVTIAGLDVPVDARAVAKRMGCSHVLLDGQVVAVDRED